MKNTLNKIVQEIWNVEFLYDAELNIKLVNNVELRKALEQAYQAGVAKASFPTSAKIK